MRRSENLCEGRCFKRLIVQVTHHLFLLCLEVCAISCWSEQLQQLISVLTFIILLSLPCPASWGEGWGGGQKRKKSTPASSRIKAISFEAILEVAMVMDNSDHWGAGITGAEESIDWRSYGQICVERARVAPRLRKWLACSAHSPDSCKAFLAESQPLHTQMKHYLTLLSMLRGSSGVLFPLRSNGPYDDALKKSTICLWGSWIQLIWRGAKFLLW